MPTNTSRPCHSMIDAEENLLDHLFTTGHPECGACGWSVCVMDGCNNYVADTGRCSECHPLACPCADCVAFDSLPDSDGVPMAVGDDDTSAVRTVRIQDVSTDELAAEWIARITTREAA